MLIIPKVTTNGVTLPMVITTPLIVPMNAPNNSVAATTATTGQPRCSKLAQTTPVSARIDPTDRSIPAVKMTNVMPTAMMPMTDV